MKKSFYLLMIFITIGLLPLAAQNSTIIGWDFSDSTDASFNSNSGLPGNLGFDIRAEDSVGVVRQLHYAVRDQDFAAAVDGWNDGADNKFWSVKFKAAGFSNMKIYSKQSSDPAAPGPRYWKIQVKKSSSGAWTDVVNGDIDVMDDWNTGVADALDLPAILDDPGSTSLYVRWIVISDESSTGVTVLPQGISMIDDIMITGINSVGIETVIFGNEIDVYPNPVTNILNIKTSSSLEWVSLYDISGALVYSGGPVAGSHAVDVSHLPAGSYVLKMKHANNQMPVAEKVLIQR